MRYFLDTEFLERPGTIDLLSLALVAEDGRELYVVNVECDTGRANEFVRLHVFPNLGHPDAGPSGSKTFGVPHLKSDEIAQRILDFIGEDTAPVFYGWYCDYDWVVFCWLFGAMVDLPRHFPQYCRDLKQTVDEVWEVSRVNIASTIPDPSHHHNALSDARWTRDLFAAVESYCAGFDHA